MARSSASRAKAAPSTPRTNTADFVARLEFKLPPGGNNGLAIRYPGKGDTAYVGMCELQVLDDNAAQVQANSTRGRPTARPTAWRRPHRGYLRPVGRMELPGSDRQRLRRSRSN